MNQAGLFNMDQFDLGKHFHLGYLLGWQHSIRREYHPLYGTAQQSFNDVDISGYVTPNVSLRTVNSIQQKYPGGAGEPKQPIHLRAPVMSCLRSCI